MNLRTPPRRWLRYSLRTLLVLITVISIWLGWKMHLRREQARVLDAVRDRGGETSQLLPDGSLISVTTARWTQNNDVWLTNLELTDEDMKEFQSMPYLVGLHLADNQLTDRGLVYLKNQTDLRVLDLTNNTAISDNGLAHLKDLTRLEQLMLRKNQQITDAGLANLEQMQQLDLLILRGTGVTPQGVSRLRKKLPRTNIIF